MMQQNIANKTHTDGRIASRCQTISPYRTICKPVRVQRKNSDDLQQETAVPDYIRFKKADIVRDDQDSGLPEVSYREANLNRLYQRF